MAQYNLKNPAVKRLMREAIELKDSTDQYAAQPLEDNLFEWHFTFRGPTDSDFKDGIYHGRITLPPEYPMKPPSIMLLTPNGRFELNKKICLSISGYHPESWQPSWSIRTAILAIIGFMPTKGEGAIGALDYTTEERQTLAKKSQTFSCTTCGPTHVMLQKPGEYSYVKSEKEKQDEELAKKINFSKPNITTSETPSTSTSTSQPGTVAAANEQGLRQRTSTDAPVQATQQTAVPRGPIQPNIPRQNEDSTSLMLIIVLSVVLAILLFRRLDRMYGLQSNISDLF